MTLRDLQKASYITQSLAIEAGDYILKNRELMEIENKDVRDVVTNVDKVVEKKIRGVLGEEFHSHGFVVEEGTSSLYESEYKWVIDPIDGTKYYAAEVPLFTVSIGLMQNDQPILGTVYNPVSRQLYWSYKGAGAAYMNNQKIVPQNVVRNKSPIISIDESKFISLSEEEKKKVISKNKLIAEYFYRARYLGQGSLSLIWLVLGAFDAYVDITGNTKLVDVAGGLIILTESGYKYEFVKSGSRTHLVAASDQTTFNLARKLVEND